jgi:hypothetical protein
MQQCELCGKATEQPIAIIIYRHEGDAETHKVCSGTCEQRLWEREQDYFSGYIIEPERNVSSV